MKSRETKAILTLFGVKVSDSEYDNKSSEFKDIRKKIEDLKVIESNKLKTAVKRKKSCRLTELNA